MLVFRESGLNERKVERNITPSSYIIIVGVFLAK